MAYEIIFQVLLVLAFAVFTGEVFEQFRLPSVAGELLSGVILGPTVLGVVSSNDQLQAISEFSLFFIIFLIGFEMNTETLKRHMRHAALLTVTSFVVPLGVSFSVAGFLLPFGLTPDFVVALALAVPSISIISVLVMQYNMIEKESGRIIISSVAVTDILAFIVLVAVSSSIPNTAEVVVETALFIVAFVLVDWVLNYRPKMVRGFLGRVGGWAKREDIAYAALIVVGLAVAAIFQAIGLSYIIGAFFAGLIVHDGLIGRKAFQEVSHTFARMNRALFIPFFFGFAGLEADLTSSSYGLLPVLAVVTAVMLVPAVALTYYGAKSLFKVKEEGGPKRIALTLGGRGAVGIVVASVALASNVIDGTAYSLIVIGTLAVSLLVPLLLGRKGEED